MTVSKYGILFKPTNEYVSYDNESNKLVLFNPDQNLVKAALYDLLYADGGYDGSFSDFEVVKVNDIDEDFDGSELLDENTIFVSKDIIDNKE